MAAAAYAVGCADWNQQCRSCSRSVDPTPVALVLQVQSSQLLEALVRLSRAVKQLQGQAHTCAGEVQQQVRSSALPSS